MSCKGNSHDQKMYIYWRTYRSCSLAPHGSWSGMFCLFSFYIEKERGASSCRSFHGVRPSHCPSSRNEQRGIAPREVYITLSLTYGNSLGWYTSLTCVWIHLHEAFTLLCFWLDDERLRSSTPSKPKRPENAFLYMSADDSLGWIPDWGQSKCKINK